MIIVSGASGFIGAYCVEQLLKEGYTVVATSRTSAAEDYYKRLSIPFHTLDVSNEEDFAKLPHKDVEAFVHLAAIIPAALPDLDAKKFLLGNSYGTYNSLRFCRANGIKRFISTTSHFAVEGFWGLWDTEKKKISEDMGENFKFTGNHTLYIISKIAAEQYAEHFMQEYGMNNVTYRLTGVYGFGRYSSALELFINKAQKGEPITIYDNPDRVRDHIYVKDVVHALVIALQNQNVSGLYNLSSGKPYTLREEVEHIVNAVSPPEQRSEITVAPTQKSYPPSSYVYDMSKLKKDGGFEPQYSYEEMVRDIVKERDENRYYWLSKKNG